MVFKLHHEAESEVCNNVEIHEIQKDCDQVRNYLLFKRSLRCGHQCTLYFYLAVMVEKGI